MKYFYFILIAFAIVSCETAEKPAEPVVLDEPEVIPTGTTEEIMVQTIRKELEMNALEKFDYTIHKGELNGDNHPDWIVTINLLNRAINEAANSDKTAKLAAMGFMGNYNYILFMDGATEVFSPLVVIPSSAYGKLDITFMHLSSISKTDFVVDLKIRNSRRKRYYTISNNIPFQIGEEVAYYDYGKDGKETESYAIEYELNADGTANNVLVYEGILPQIHFEDPQDVYSANPEIKSSGNLVRKWYFHPIQKKYYMRKDEI